MQNAPDTHAAPAGPSATRQTAEPAPSAQTAADLEDKLRNFPVPELQFRLLIKSVPGLAA